jgi:hypothetical protein
MTFYFRHLTRGIDIPQGNGIKYKALYLFIINQESDSYRQNL